MPAHGFLCRYV